MGTKALMTVEQFAAMRRAETEDYELVEGELIPLSSGTYRHNRIRDLIGHLLWSCFRQNPIGEAVGENDCRIDSGEVRRPDLSIFLNDRLKQIDLDKIPLPSRPISRSRSCRRRKARSICAIRSAIICAAAARKYGCWTTRTARCR